MPSLNIFDQDAFGVVQLTDAVSKLKFVPNHLGQMGLFQGSSTNTLTIMIEERDGVLTLVSPTPRGGPGQTLPKPKRAARSLRIPHFQIDDAIYADEVQGVRAFGSETELETVQGKVAERLQIHTQSLEATDEYSRIGAVKGIVTYNDGSSLNLFTEFGVSQIAERDWDLDSGSPGAGVLRKTAAAVTRQIAGELDGIPFSGVHALCGDAFFDDLIAHPEVRASYLQQQEASELRKAYVSGAGSIFGRFEFGGIVWENYRGKVGATDYINADKAHFFPTGVPGLFRTVHAPADYEETVNTMGLPRYAKQYAAPNGKSRALEVQTNVIHYCTRPRVLLQGKRT